MPNFLHPFCTIFTKFAFFIQFPYKVCIFSSFLSHNPIQKLQSLIFRAYKLIIFFIVFKIANIESVVFNVFCCCFIYFFALEYMGPISCDLNIIHLKTNFIFKSIQISELFFMIIKLFNCSMFNMKRRVLNFGIDFLTI